jgi:hypothetical protein
MAVAVLRATSTAAGLAGRLGRSLVILVSVILVTGAGVGWLYVLRSGHVAGAGPHVAEALPLQRLARDDAQPLLRLVLAWLPAGLVAGFAVQAAWPLARPVRALVVAAIALATLVVGGAASDAVTANLRFSGELHAQYGRSAIWLAVALMALGALIPRPASRHATAAPAVARLARRLRAGGRGAA